MDAIIDAMNITRLRVLADAATGKNKKFLQKTADDAERRFMERYSDPAREEQTDAAT